MGVAELTHNNLRIGAAALDVVICGSFRRDPASLKREYDELRASGCQILSPLGLTFADERDGFVYLDHEVDHEPTEIERGHLEAIQSADMVWLHAPGGYLGPSGAFEIGAAHTAGVPVYAGTPIIDVGLREFVTVVASPHDAVIHCKTMVIHKPGEPLKALQTYYLRAALARGWDTEGATECMLLLTEEVGELARSVRRYAGLARHGADNSENAAEELADVQLYLVHLANVLQVDLASAVSNKEAENLRRFLTGSRAA
jgi:NTP pyrophosphatase (non-canonical NTP hydrolase)